MNLRDKVCRSYNRTSNKLRKKANKKTKIYNRIKRFNFFSVNIYTIADSLESVKNNILTQSATWW